MATVDTEWIATATERLRDSGRRSGGARAEVIEQIASETCAVSADDLADSLRDRGRRVARASVYRALEALSDVDLVQRVELGDGNSRWERVGASAHHHHHHLVCRSCGQVVPFEDERLEESLAALSRRSDFVVDSHDVTLHGRCSSCVDSGGED